MNSRRERNEFRVACCVYRFDTVTDRKDSKNQKSQEQIIFVRCDPSEFEEWNIQCCEIESGRHCQMQRDHEEQILDPASPDECVEHRNDKK